MKITSNNYENDKIKLDNEALEKFYNVKTGYLSRYSLACGYIEKVELDNTSITLALDSGIFHVKAYDFENHKRIEWKCFEHYSKAIRKFEQLIRQIAAQHLSNAS